MSYMGTHNKIRRVRGSARNFTCPRGDQAQEWAYNNHSESELVDELGRRYSRSLSDYDFLEPEARDRFEALLDKLRKQVLDAHFAGLADAIKGVTPEGRTYTIGRNVFTGNSEFAGACFSPDGQVLFVNIMYPGVTFAIRGPWTSVRT